MNYDLTKIEKKIEDLFNDDPNNPVDKELYKWFMYSVAGPGRGIKDLNALDFKVFKDRLKVLVDTIYQWQKEIE